MGSPTLKAAAADEADAGGGNVAGEDVDGGLTGGSENQGGHGHADVHANGAATFGVIPERCHAVELLDDLLKLSNLIS